MEKERMFADRQKTSGDDGDDFENFVVECFRVAKDEAGFAKSLRRGRDGAIDLVDHRSVPGATKVAECKYIGDGALKEASARWHEVFVKLRDHLPPLAADPTANPNSPYRGWIDPGRPVHEYRFCITVKLTKNDVVVLERAITRDLATLIDAGVEALRPLVETPQAIRVLPWDWFAAVLDEHPVLAFRWFGGLPVGINLFDPTGRQGQSFRDFLSGAQLPYFSRDRFAAETSGSAVRGETQLAIDLAAGRIAALVLSGPGGVGKTRLAHELAIRLTDEPEGYEAYWLDRSATAESIHRLARSHVRPARLLFLVDYAEAAQRLAELGDAIAWLGNQGGHRATMIATCRASAENAVRDALELLSTDIKSLASPIGGEDRYLAWVTRSIVGLEPFPDQERVVAVCRRVPALAAFAVYLFRHDRAQFDAQFGALLVDDDFRSWSRTRIGALVRDDRSSERALAEIALALPIPAEREAAFRARHRELIDRLLTDRWVEHVDGELAAAHDILADALLARWIFEAETSATGRVTDLLVDAARAGDLPHALTVLGRLATHPRFRTLDGHHVLQALVATVPDQLVASAGPLIESLAFDVADKLALIAGLPGLAQAIRIDGTLQVRLARLAQQAAALAKTTPVAVPDVIGELLDIACLRRTGSNFVLRRAFALLPDRFRDRAFDDLAAYPEEEETQFLIAQMLRSGEPAAAMQRAVRAWLAVNGTKLSASFVYEPWLVAKGDLDVVRGPLLAWIAVHQRALGAQFVLKAWLDASRDPATITDAVVAWLDVHGLVLSAEYVLDAWLDRHGDIEVVRDPLIAWVKAHTGHPVASHVYARWLIAGGDPAAIAGAVIAWIRFHGRDVVAHHVYSAWLDAGGPRDMVAAALVDWVADHGGDIRAGIVYASWLQAGGDRDAIDRPLAAWLATHGDVVEAGRLHAALLQTERQDDVRAAQALRWLAVHALALPARYVYKAWLESRRDRTAIVGHLQAWLDVHGLDLRGEGMFKLWLQHGGEIAPIARPLFAWTLRWHHTEQFVFLSKAISSLPVLPEPIVLAVADWALRHPQHEDSVSRVRRLVSHLRRDRMSFEGLHALTAYLSRIVAARRQFPPFDRTQWWSICAALSEPDIYNAHPAAVTRLVAAVIRTGTVFDPTLLERQLDRLIGSQVGICHLATVALRDGLLDPDRDRDAIEKLIGWLEVYGLDVAERTRLAAKLRRALAR